MAQLHELLAVETDLKAARDKVKEEITVEFEKKAGYYVGEIKKLEMYDESRKLEEKEEYNPLTYTVPKQLKYMSDYFIRYWDLKLQKEMANQEAKADIIIDNVVLFKGLPVTFLLAMEEELKQLRKIYAATPTLNPGIDWVVDETKGPDVYKSSKPVIKHKTEKTIEHKVIVSATKEHPAQVSEWSEDKPVGNYITETWSGMLSPFEKMNLLRKLDKIIIAVKKARQRANNQEVQQQEIGGIIFDYIHKGL